MENTNLEASWDWRRLFTVPRQQHLLECDFEGTLLEWFPEVLNRQENP